MIFIWGIKKEPTAGQEDMVEKAESFLEWLEKEKHIILLPTPIIAEVLRPVPIESENYQKYLDIINTRFRVVPFDTIASVKCAEILHIKDKNTDFHTFTNAEQITRRKIKFDALIVAIAVTRQAECIYSNDNGLRKLAEGFIDAKEMPSIPRQLKLIL